MEENGQYVLLLMMLTNLNKSGNLYLPVSTGKNQGMPASEELLQAEEISTTDKLHSEK